MGVGECGRGPQQLDIQGWPGSAPDSAGTLEKPSLESKDSLQQLVVRFRLPTDEEACSVGTAVEAS